ncbi:flagellar brake protein [Gracilinema caldarium]|uniref:Type IV pilus assembly PilZ n=1 Tax=Gracilinema caldarium (strain ATCC 51460 / DSM 7334 / H1) TaxID=744872 RepID=F8F0M5_GRAC1|nr:PilZ domain-containing protein [Gracilinema caldarium]AEJ19732.1 type IV pilus assembly PilZ [Gracilinema caldarium DSM 7334]
MLYFMLIIIATISLIILLTFRSDSKEKYSWLEFFAKGKDAGFSFGELQLLRKLAISAELEDPTTLFWSEKQLDRCIRELIKKAEVTGASRNQETQDFLSKLYEYRKKIEFEHPRYKKGITSSRSIGETQPIKILIDGMGVYKSQVVANSDRFLTIQKPNIPPQKGYIVWKGKRLAIYFWRKDDAGYVFDSYVLDEAMARGMIVLQIAHSDSLFRTQKRRSIRARTHKPAYLYLPPIEEAPEKIEIKPGLRCIIEDLSDTGCAITIGGKGVEGLRVKVQFEIDNQPVVMNGTVRSVDYDEEKKRSLLHVEAVPLSLTTRNRILAEVFGVKPDNTFDYLFYEDEIKSEKTPVLSMEGTNEVR